MKKKIFQSFLLILLLFSLSACTKNNKNTDSLSTENNQFASSENIATEEGLDSSSKLDEEKSNSENNNNLDKNMNQDLLKKYSQAELETNYGNFSIKFFNDKMPITVANFLNLADSGYFDGTKFHRVIKGFMIQGGDPLTKDDDKKDYWGTGGPGYVIEDEHVADPELSNLSGTISMANAGPNSGGSQFFINVADNTFLDFDKEPLNSKHPVFGKVISGMDVVEKISRVKTLSPGYLDRPVEDVIIKKINLK